MINETPSTQDEPEPNEEKSTKINKIKAHIVRHKVVYSVGTAVVIAGVAYYVGYRSGSVKVLSPVAKIVGDNNKLDQRVITLVDRPGPPSWITYCVETGEETLSQGKMALAHGISDGDLSAHLNYGKDLPNNMHYGRRGLAA